MYKYKKRPSKFKRFFLIFLLIIIVSFLSIYIYNMYLNIDVYSTEEQKGYEVSRLSQTVSENEKEAKQEDITEVLDKTIKCVVGISKIKNTGNSIFLNNSTSDLGLGTGMVLTDNRIYFDKLTCCRK